MIFFKNINSFSDVIGTRKNVTNSGIKVIGYGDVYSYLTFQYAGGWGVEFPNFHQTVKKW